MKNREGLTRYTESASIDHRLLKKAESVELKESLKKCSRRLIESLESEAAEGWWVPISFYNKKNGNGRVYNRQLWENVINNQREVYCGAPMLADHPEGDSDGSPKDICGVWVDAKLGKPEANGNGLVYGLLVPSGKIGEDLKDHLKHGLRIGTSSSGFGKLMSDGVTVDPNSYQIERLSDWVLNPSQGTYFSWDESSDIQDKSIRESQEWDLAQAAEMVEDAADSGVKCNGSDPVDCMMNIARKHFNFEPWQLAVLEEYFTERFLEKKNNSYKNNFKENVVSDSKITDLEKKKFRRDMESFLESANNIKDPQKRLEEFKEIRSYLEEGACPDLKEKVEAKITEQEALISQMLKESMEMRDELKIEGTRDLKEKLAKISEDVSLLKTEARDWKEVSRKVQAKYLEAKKELKERPTAAYVEYQNLKIDELSEKSEKSIALLKELKEAYKATLNENADLKKQISNTSKIDAVLQENAALKKKLNLSDSQVKMLAESLNVSGAKNREMASDIHKASEAFKEYQGASEKFSLEEKASRKNNEAALKEANAKIAALLEALKKQSLQLKESEKRRKFNTSVRKSALAESKADLAKAKTQIRELEEANSRKKEMLTAVATELKEKQVNEKKLTKVVEAKQEEKSMNEVDRYFESLYQTYGNEILPYEKKIRSSITLSEAKKYFFKNVLQGLKESTAISNMQLPENLYTDPEERIEVMNKNNFKKTSAVDRLPKGWY